MKMLPHNILSVLLAVVLNVFVSSCSQQEASPREVSTNSSISSRGVQANDFAPGQLEMHFVKHGYQFGPITESEYLEDARALLDAPVGPDILEKVRDNGDILHYRPSTREFAVMTNSGRIRTFFKTSVSYWEKQ